MPDETPLAGGRLGGAVRVADTVRRAAGPWTPAVHALLAHLEARGFAAAPRALGIDEQGREILTYLPGETVGDAGPPPAWTRSEATLVEAARLLRRYHEAVADFVQPEGTRWRLTEARVQPGEIVCHNDFAPYNVVRGPAGLCGLLDFDVASPGAPVADVAFAAWNFVPLFDDAHCTAALGFRAPPDREGRLRRFVDAYGLEAREGFVERITTRMQQSIDRIRTGARAGDPAFRALVEGGRLEPVRAALRLVERAGDALQRAIEV